MKVELEARSHVSSWAQLIDFTEAISLKLTAVIPDPEVAQKLFPACPSLLGMHYGSETRLHILGWEWGTPFWCPTGNSIKARREAAVPACGNGQSLPRGKIPYSVMSCLTSRREGMGSMAT